MKKPAAKLPQLMADMTHPQFRKFCTDWDVYKRITNIPETQIHTQLYHTCDDNVQNSLVNTVPDFFAITEKELLSILESIVTKKCNPTVLRMSFCFITHSHTEPVKDYVVRLKSVALDCEFSCPSCQHDLTPLKVKDQFIRGLYNETLQTDILAKASQLTSLEDTIKHAEAFETALWNQTSLQKSAEVQAA